MTTTPRRVSRWTLGRRLTDRFIPHVLPGRHHVVWGTR